jgi:hypothetical protein
MASAKRAEDILLSLSLMVCPEGIIVGVDSELPVWVSASSLLGKNIENEVW